MAAGCNFAGELEGETARRSEPDAADLGAASVDEFSFITSFTMDDGVEFEVALLGAVAGGRSAAGMLSAEEFVASAFARGSEDWCKYQVTPAMASTIPAAIAVIKIFLLPLGVFAGALAAVPSSVRPKTGGVATVARLVEAVARVGEAGAGFWGSVALNSSNSEEVELDVLDMDVGSGGAGTAALRARGSSQAGIFTSSASNSGVAETGGLGWGIV
jgi:hypothetical protein